MRRRDREIKDFSKMLDIMKACDCCRLGFVDEQEAYIVPWRIVTVSTDGRILES